MKPRERQDKILAHLMEQGVLHILELRERFQVSEGTIRNDLRALESAGKLIRTHGGATSIVARHSPFGKLHRRDGIAAPEAAHTLAQSRLRSIARRAAELISEGDVILLSSGAMTQAMAEELQGMRSLVILTNSLDIAQQLSHNPAHTVILIGGQMRVGHDALDGPLAASVLERMRVSKAFITCDGVSMAQGFASNDITDAQVKASMVQCADTVVMMAPGDAVGKLALMSFAGLNQVHQLITTNDSPTEAISALMAAGVRVSVCGERITEVCADGVPERKWRIGFANLTEQQDFSVAVRQSIERAAAQLGNIELILTDNETDPAAAMENARRMLDAKVDLVVEYQQDEHTNYVLMDLFRTAGVRVIAIDIPMPGAVYFGADNYRAGRIAGEAAVNWIREHWNGKLDKVVCLEQSESGSIPAARIHGALVTLRSMFPLQESDILHYDTRGGLDESRSAATQALRNIPWGRKVLFIGINANSTIGALEAAEVLGRQGCTAVVSQNVSKRVRSELRRKVPMLIGGVDYFPHIYGEHVLKMALNMLNGQSVPPAAYTEHLLITADNVDRIYPEEHSESRGNGDGLPPKKIPSTFKPPVEGKPFAAIQSIQGKG
jgi:ribose transport system substrate-binding protein